MAQQAGSVQQQDTCFEVSCPVCLEFFQDPKILNCGHSVCDQCVKKLVEQTALTLQQTGIFQILCPQCRTPTVVPSQGLPTNFGLKELLVKFKATETELGKIRSSRSQLCTECQAMQPLDQFWHCLGCHRGHGSHGYYRAAATRGPHWICSTCALRCHNGHKLVAYAEMKEKALLAIEKARECSEQNSMQVQQGVGSFAGTFNKLTPDIFHALEEKVKQLDEIQAGLLRNDGICTHDEFIDAEDKSNKLEKNVKLISQRVRNCTETALRDLEQCLRDLKAA